MNYYQQQNVSLGALEQYMREVKQMPAMAPEEELPLVFAIQGGSNAQLARDRLITGYLPLVIGLAKRFVRNCRKLELLDLIQEGNLGLLEALAKFDPSKGEASFRTFAFSWVRAYMLAAFWQYERTIRLPLHKVRAIRQMGAVITRLFSECGREPTIAETAREMQVSERTVRELVVLQEQQVVSLHAFSSEDEDSSLEDVIADPTATSSTDHRLFSVEEALEHLTERERVVIELRFGFTDGQAYTQKEVADLLGVALPTVVALDRRAQKRLRQALSA